MKRMLSLLALGLALLGAGPRAADAQGTGETLRTRYTISLLGLPVGRADFETRVEGERFTLAGTLGSSGIAELFASTQGSSSVEGRLGAAGTEPSRYRLSYRSGDESYSSDVRFRAGAAVSASVAPPPRSPPPDDYVPVRRSDLASTVDPLSGLMLRPAGDPASICMRRLPFFDGWTRLDLQLAPAGREEVSIDGYDGPAIVCAARIAPVSGYRSGSSGLRYLRGQTIRISFAPAGASGIWAPIDVRIPTRIGPLTVRASVFARG